MDWHPITEISQLDDIYKESFEVPCLIFKHSTTCPISFAAKMRVDDFDSSQSNVKSYFLDLLQFRSISNAISETFNVHHESPQLILLKDGECIYDESHLDITLSELSAQVPTT